MESPGRYLDIDAVEVEAVYVLGAEVFTHLTGGVGRVLDPLSGNERHIETSDVSLTWRCQGRRSAAKLADRLNEWEASGAHLRLMATRGRCASVDRRRRPLGCPPGTTSQRITGLSA